MPLLMTKAHFDTMDLALTLLDRHGIGDEWSFEFDRAKTRLGCCRYNERLITLSAHFIAARTTTMEKIQDTILHEIAHALVGHANGHNRVWQRKAIEIGARPARCGQAFHEQPSYVMVCPKCTLKVGFHRKVKRIYVCKRCPSRPRLLSVGQ